jgi:hypothetical protein
MNILFNINTLLGYCTNAFTRFVETIPGVYTHDIHSMLESLCALTCMAVGTRHSTIMYSITMYYLTGAFTRDYGLLVASAPPTAVFILALRKLQNLVYSCRICPFRHSSLALWGPGALGFRSLGRHSQCHRRRLGLATGLALHAVLAGRCHPHPILINQRPTVGRE